MHDDPLVVHLIYRLDLGGLETLLVERINRMEGYRHAVLCLTDYNPAFADKIRRPGVALYALHKRPGLSLSTHGRLWRLLRRLRPAIFHSYNLSAVEYGPVALLAGVPVRVNGMHGRDAGDPHGTNRKHRLLRRLMLPFYHCCYANSAAMLAWGRDLIGMAPQRSRLLPNGVDADTYRPRGDGDVQVQIAGDGGAAARGRFGAGGLGTGAGDMIPGAGPDAIVIGTVGRATAVKDHASLLAAFALLRRRAPDLAGRLRLAIVGDGPALAALRAQAAAAGLADAVWLPGARADVAPLLRRFAIFAISSLAEGTPGAALEAMASGLPVVGTRVGGIPEVIEDGVTGALVAPADPGALAAALERYARAPALAAAHGAAARRRVLRHYSMEAMVAGYRGMYDSLRHSKDQPGKVAKSCAE